MKFTTLATMLAAYAATAQATITYEFFTGQNFTGKSVQDKLAINTCSGLPTGFDNAVRSVIVANSEQFQIALTFYNDLNCKGTNQRNIVAKTSFFSEKTLPAQFDKQWSSFRYVQV